MKERECGYDNEERKEDTRAKKLYLPGRYKEGLFSS